MARTLPTSIRFDPEIKEAITRAAKVEDRPFTGLIEHVMRAWLTEHGYLEKPPVPLKRKAAPKSGG